MADGSKTQVGDWVLATDPETGEQVAKRVDAVFVHDDTVLDLIVDGERITTTEDHPFWSVTDWRFERADQLAPGEDVVRADGRVLAVAGQELESAREALAYSLSIEGIHTYHVGRANVLVHNACRIPVRVVRSNPRSARRAARKWKDGLQRRGYECRSCGPCGNGDYQHVEYRKNRDKWRTIHFGPKSAK